jgi:hypothetical protein
MLADRAKVKEKLVELLPKFKRKINRQVCICFSAFCKSVAEPRAEEPKLNCLPEPELKLRIAAQVPFYLPQTSRKLYCKKMVAEEPFVHCYNFNPIT